MFIQKKLTTEEEIIKRCISGDRKAQQYLYDQFCGSFLAICIRYLKDRDLAEDVMIEGFMKIFDKLHQFAGKGSFEGWMKKIIVREALMALRKNKALLLEVSLDGHEHLYDQSSVLDEMNSKELMEMIEELPLGYRTVFNLYAIEGYTHLEISELLGIAESTSKSQLSRARNVLKQKLADVYHTERRING